MNIGENMRRIRTEKKMTQRQVAEKCSISASTYKTYENGLANPKPGTVAKLATGLGVTVEELYGIASGTAIPTDMLQAMLADSGNSTSDCASQYNCLLLSYKKLNRKGREEAVRRIAEMACVPEYSTQ